MSDWGRWTIMSSPSCVSCFLVVVEGHRLGPSLVAKKEIDGSQKNRRYRLSETDIVTPCFGLTRVHYSLELIAIDWVQNSLERALWNILTTVSATKLRERHDIYVYVLPMGNYVVDVDGVRSTAKRRSSNPQRA